MSVTKQQQLEYLVNRYGSWPIEGDSLSMSGYDLGIAHFVGVHTKSPVKNGKQKKIKRRNK